MKVFPGISPVLEREQDVIRNELGRAQARIPADVLREYRASLAKEEEADSSGRPVYGDWYLRNAFRHAGFLQARVVFDRRTVLRFGAELAPWDAPLHTPIPAERQGKAALAMIRRARLRRDRSLYLEAIAPLGLEQMGEYLFDQELMPLASNYYFHSPSIADPRLINHAEFLDVSARSILEESLAQNRPVTLTHFRFQNLHVYFEMSGEHRAREIMQEIMDVIHDNLKRDDLLIQVTPISYVVLSPGARREQILDRFQRIYFQIRSLVLEYRMRVATVDRKPVRLNEIWRQLEL